MLLAPVIEGRKGEHQEVLDSLRAQGYVRQRDRRAGVAVLIRPRRRV